MLTNGACIGHGTTVCPTGSTLINGVCQINITACPSGTTLKNGICQINATSCPTGTTLVNGTCQYPSTGCTAGMTLVNGVCKYPSTGCTAGMTLVNGTCQYPSTGCPTGTTLVNGVCQLPVQCPANSTRINGVCQAPIVCPTGTVLTNGSCLGNGTTVCPTGSTLINGVCQINITACPSGTTLTNGICQINVTSCPTGTTLSNGACHYPASGCPTGTTLVNGVCQLPVQCPNNSTPINGVCQAPIVCPTGTSLQNGVCIGHGTTVCPTGSTLVNGVCQINTTACPSGSVLINGICQITITQNNYRCSNGSIVAAAYLCPTIPVPPVYTPSVTYTYDNTYIPPMNSHVCWDGSTMYGNQVCPAQYKVCANGTYVSMNQSCYVAPVPTYVPPTVIKFNNVVTSVATQITNTSGRCNGIGLIANGAASTGWFEYGETANLGRTTASASIGNTVTAPFSNVLANLKPTTKYYCRAVMQNEYGIVKGEIVSFVTKSKATTYVQPVSTVKTSTVKKATTTVKKNEVTCTDGTSVWVKNGSSAEMLNQGAKLVMLQIEKSEGKLMANASVTYKVTYKNVADSRLTGVVIKVVIPAEMNSVVTTAGVYDENTHTVTLNQDTLDQYSEGVISVTGKLAQDAPIGKTLVATSYVAYTVPGTNAQDEVTAYVVGSIVPVDSLAKSDTGAKKVIGSGSDRGFMPNNLVEWLALIAIIFIIFILGRSIYISYKEDEGGNTSGH